MRAHSDTRALPPQRPPTARPSASNRQYTRHSTGYCRLFGRWAGPRAAHSCSRCSYAEVWRAIPNRSSARARPASAKRVARARSRRTVARASANASGSSGATSRPVTPWSTTSGRPPTAWRPPDAGPGRLPRPRDRTARGSATAPPPPTPAGTRRSRRRRRPRPMRRDGRGSRARPRARRPARARCRRPPSGPRGRGTPRASTAQARTPTSNPCR